MLANIFVRSSNVDSPTISASFHNIQVLDCLPEGQYPGSLLIKLGLGTLRQFSESAAEWQAEALKLRKRTSYLLRVHVYQVRDERDGKGCRRLSSVRGGWGEVWLGLEPKNIFLCLCFCAGDEFSDFGGGWLVVRPCPPAVEAALSAGILCMYSL